MEIIPKHPELAVLFNEWVSKPEVLTRIAAETQQEVTRQLIYGLPPSGGLPDMRPNRPRFNEVSA